MPPTYVQPTREQVETALKVPQHFKLVENPLGSELLYDWPVRPGAWVRVCSSITGKVGREVGQDAIRVIVLNVEADHVFFKATRVHRTQNWQANMMRRVREAWDFVQAMKACEYCGKVLQEGISKRGNPYIVCVDKTCQSEHQGAFRKGVSRHA